MKLLLPALQKFAPAGIFSVVLLSGPSLAQGEDWTGTCSIRFAGTSTLHDFAGTVGSEPFTVSISDRETPEKARAKSTMSVKVAKMSTNHKKRDQEMRKTLQADRFPEIRIRTDLGAENIRPRFEGGQPVPTVIPFTITVFGRNHTLQAPVSSWNATDSSIRFNVAMPLSLTKLGIEPPKVMGGLIKVRDRIDLTATVTLRKR